MTTSSRSKLSLFEIGLAAIIVCLSIPTGWLMYLGTFNRLYADDFCAVWVIRSMSLWEAIVFWYTTWTVRYTSVVLISLQGLGWVGLATSIAAIYLILWLAAFAWAILPALQLRAGGQTRPARQDWLLALAAALTVVLATLYMAPSLVQSFYWQSARTAYTYPLVIGTFLAGWFIRQVGRPASGLSVLLFGLLAWVNSGLSEVYTAAQIVLFGMLTCAIWVFGSKDRQKRLVPFALAGLAASILGLVVIMAAPGNQARITASSASFTTNPVQLVLLSLKYAFKLGLSFGAIYRWVFLFLAAAGLAGGFVSAPPASAAPQPLAKQVLPLALTCGLIGLACFGLVVAASAPPVYALASDLDPRAQIVPLYLIVFTVLLCTFLIGRQLKSLGLNLPPRLALAAGGVLILGMLVWSGWMSAKALQSLPEYQTQAQGWDLRDAQLSAARSAGLQDVEAPGLPSWQGLQDLREEPDFWVNDCMAKTYGLQTIRGK